MFINLSEENEHLHHRRYTTRKDPTNLKGIPLPWILRESAKREKTSTIETFDIYNKAW